MSSNKNWFSSDTHPGNEQIDISSYLSNHSLFLLPPCGQENTSYCRLKGADCPGRRTECISTHDWTNEGAGDRKETILTIYEINLANSKSQGIQRSQIELKSLKFAWCLNNNHQHSYWGSILTKKYQEHLVPGNSLHGNKKGPVPKDSANLANGTWKSNTIYSTSPQSS